MVQRVMPACAWPDGGTMSLSESDACCEGTARGHCDMSLPVAMHLVPFRVRVNVATDAVR